MNKFRIWDLNIKYTGLIPNSNVFSQGERIATKLITGIQKQRMRNERELFLEFAEEHGCPLSADPALTDVALAHKLERNRQIRTRKVNNPEFFGQFRFF